MLRRFGESSGFNSSDFWFVLLALVPVRRWNTRWKQVARFLGFAAAETKCMFPAVGANYLAGSNVAVLEHFHRRRDVRRADGDTGDASRGATLGERVHVGSHAVLGLVKFLVAWRLSVSGILVCCGVGVPSFDAWSGRSKSELRRDLSIVRACV